MTAAAEIRPFQPGDRSQVLALAPRLTEGVAPWRDPAAVRRAAQNWVQTSIDTASQPGHAVYVAIASDRVVGVVSIREQPHFTGQTDAYIGELAVAPGMERRGIATALMNAAEAWAAKRGLAFVTLHTGAANQPARNLYRRLGYHEEELLLTKAIPARHNHPTGQRHNRQLSDPPRGTRHLHAAQSRQGRIEVSNSIRSYTFDGITQRGVSDYERHHDDSRDDQPRQQDRPQDPARDEGSALDHGLRL